MTTWATPWWDRWTGRLEYELDKLEAAGYRLLSNRETNGLRVLEIVAPDDKTGIGEVTLTVTFPDNFPFMAPQVIAPDLGLRHHQHPFGGVLCLIGRSTRNWESQHYLAELLDSQLRKALDAGAAPTGEGIDELDQAEPFVSYYTYEPNVEFLSDDDGSIQRPQGAGEAEFWVAGAIPPPEHGRTLGLIASLHANGELLHEAGPALRGLFDDAARRVRGRWVVLDGPVRVNEPELIWRAAASAAASVRVAPGGTPELMAVGFPDETSRTELGTSWVVLIRQAGTRRHPKRRCSGNPAKAAAERRSPDAFLLARVDRAGATDLTARSPLTASTSESSVMVVGCGAIGSVLVDHLARAGVGRFALVDRDVVEPGNLTRHAATLHTTGMNKAVAMARHIAAVNPYARAIFCDLPVGAPASDASGRVPGDVLAELMAGVDLVIDASAEVGVQETTAYMARQLGVDWMMLSASEGAAGGTVVLVDADADWCFACFQRHRADDALPFPPAITGPAVQPVGCAEPTFVGAGFDLAEISLQAARTATARLLRGKPDPYPEDGHDAWVGQLRHPDGARIPPVWKGYAVQRHPSCADHQAHP